MVFSSWNLLRFQFESITGFSIFSLFTRIRSSHIALRIFRCLSKLSEEISLQITFYPNATSSTIMRLNPAAKNMVPMLEWSPADISGINSSTTTYSIAPAAKLTRYGSSGTIRLAARIVRIAPIGYTTPDATPAENALIRLMPSPRSGIEMIAPSGKF